MVEADSPAGKDKLFVHCYQDSREHSHGPTPSLFRCDKRLKISQRNVDLGRDQLISAEILNLRSSERWSIQNNRYYIAYNCAEFLKLYLSEDFSGVKREKEVAEKQGDVFRLKIKKKNVCTLQNIKIRKELGTIVGSARLVIKCSNPSITKNQFPRYLVLSEHIFLQKTGVLTTKTKNVSL